MNIQEGYPNLPPRDNASEQVSPLEGYETPLLQEQYERYPFLYSVMNTIAVGFMPEEQLAAYVNEFVQKGLPPLENHGWDIARRVSSASYSVGKYELLIEEWVNEVKGQQYLRIQHTIGNRE